MKIIRILSLIIACLTLISATAISVSASDSSTLEDLFMDPELFKAKEFIENSRKNADHESLHGLTVCLLGDSYLKGNEMANAESLIWPALLAQKYDWELLNYAENGAAMSPANKMWGKTPISEQYLNIPDGTEPDLIIFDGGRNDFRNTSNIGQIGGKKSTNTDTFCGAMNMLIDGLQAKYPSATIIYTTVWNFPNDNGDDQTEGRNNANITYQNFVDAATGVCREQGIALFKAYDPEVSGVDMTSSEFRQQYCMSSGDISHLNADGMMLVMPEYESFIVKALSGETDFEDEDKTDESITEPDTEPETEPEAEPETEPEAEPETEADSESNSEIETESDTLDDTSGVGMVAILGGLGAGAVVAVVCGAVAAAAVIAATIVIVVLIVKKKRKK